MAERSWTKPQRDAIDARGGALLVSAAAGSGKTAVLVERAIQLICGGENPVSADKLLIVTFSNAAAAEMKQRIAARLSAMIRETPGDMHLQKQQALLAGAQISTIHSFCLELIRSNFQNLSVAPDFSIADQNELDIMKHDCARDAVEQFYQEDEEGSFSDLVELLSSGRDDGKLLETIFRIYDFSRSHPFYESWLDDKLAMYDPSIPVEETLWGRTVFRHVQQTLEYCATTYESAMDYLYGDEKLEKGYLPAFQSDLRQVRECLESARARDWDETVRRLGSFVFDRLGAVRGEDRDKQRAKAVRDRNKKLIGELAEKYMNATREDFALDVADLAPKIKVLFALVKEFARRLDEAKGEKRRLDFSDLEHLALRLLVEKTGEGYQRTAHAREIAEAYEYILVDEYQDTNEVQDLIFTSVSRHQENLFMVGDVKQSIYSFRQAMPEIFMKKKEVYSPYDSGRYPATISLDTNFRSRGEVTEGVNYIFRRIMSREMGEIDYNDEESLKCGGAYPPTGQAAPELLVVDGREYEGERDAAQLEAGEIAARIREMLASGFQVADGGTMRPAVPRDFCILLRSPKSKAEAYVKELGRYGIPAWAENANGYLTAREVAAVVSLLKVLDNPLLDIELVGVLLSPFFGFQDDDIARIRLCRRGEAFFLALQAAAEEGMERSAAFLALFQELRTQAALMPANRLLLYLYNRLDALPVVRAMPMGESRAANLLLLTEYAATYHKLGYKGLGGFVGFLSRLEERGGDLSPANSLGEGANVVRIMSVHRSKGLEFPVVFLADTAKSFNKVDLKQNTLLHSRYGFACVLRDYRTLRQFPTVPMQAIRLAIEKSMLSEEMRILYVALTRAREKLIVTCLQKGDVTKKLSGLAGELVEGKLPPFVVGEAGCYADWLLMALLHHPSGIALRERGGCDGLELLGDGNPWSIAIHAAQDRPWDESGNAINRSVPAAPELVAALQGRMEYVYPHLAQTKIPAKLGVSTVAKGERNIAYRFASRPQFLQGMGMSPAERGNALHKFMQFARYEKARDNLEEEIARMREQAFLTAAEVNSLEKRRLQAFFNSPLAKRIYASPKVYRELKFTAECGEELLGGYIQGMDAQSKVVLQGVADCVFLENGRAIIVDYKTDRVKFPEELVERYTAQLELYRRILGESLGVPVGECLLYSFSLSQTIKI